MTGPTGSGKTTTLSRAASGDQSPRTSGIFTLEDPVEMTLPGIRQTQIREDIGPTFGKPRSLLRQDPDVILVGETRDSETATLMVRAAPHRPPRVLHPPHQRCPGRHSVSSTWASNPACCRTASLR